MNNKTILLINPKTDILATGDKTEALMARIRVFMYQFPIGISFISALLKQHKFNVLFADTAFESADDIRHIIRQNSPVLIGIAANIMSEKNALNTAKQIKQDFPEIKIIAGGIQPTVFPEKFLDNDFDYVIRGDGEIPFLKIAQGEDITAISGLCFKQENKLTIVSPNDQPHNLDELPFCDYETVNFFRRYPAPIGSIFKYPSYPMFGTRGCSFSCAFCCNLSFNKKYRVRSPKNIMDEIDYAVKKYKSKEIHFLDATFTLNQEHTGKLCDAFMNRKDKIIWHCSTRTDCLTKELIFKMRKAGCVSIGFGIESASVKCLEKINKPMDTKNTEDILRWCDEAGIFTKNSYMYGLPGETKKDMDKTLDFALNVPQDLVIFNRLDVMNMLKLDTKTPLEDTYRKMKESGRENDILPEASEEEIKQQLKKSMTKFLFRPKMVKRFLTKKVNIMFTINNILYVFIFLFKHLRNLKKEQSL